MEPRYVDNLSTCIQTLFELFSEATKEDENFKINQYDSDTEKYRIVETMTSWIIATVHTSLFMREPDYLHIWVNEKGQLMPTFPINTTREKLLLYCQHALRLLEIVPITQSEARGARG